MVVAATPWQKGEQVIAPAADRLAMVEAAVADLAGVEASGLEIERGGASYTADTLQALASVYPGTALSLIVGTDVAGDLGGWVRPDVVRGLAEVVVVERPGSPNDVDLGPGWRLKRVKVPAISVSSTEVRARLASRAPIDVLVPAAVVRFIADRGLYPGS